MAENTALRGAAKGRQPQWAAQFLAASELIRRGCIVSFTTGNNTPIADLMVGTPNGALFWVDVKGLTTKADWLIRPKAPRRGLFCVLVWLAALSELRLADRFFVLTQNEANLLEKKYRDEYPASKDSMPGFRFKWAEEHEGRWDKLPR